MDTFDITREFIKNILNGNAVAAETNFQDIVSVKTHETLSNRKQEIAGGLYDSTSQETENYGE